MTKQLSLQRSYLPLAESERSSRVHVVSTRQGVVQHGAGDTESTGV